MTDASVSTGAAPSVPLSGGTVASTSGIAASGETQWLAMQSKPRAQSMALEHAVRQPVTPQP
jgi:hypothetical protein